MQRGVSERAFGFDFRVVDGVLEYQVLVAREDVLRMKRTDGQYELV